MNYFGLFFSFMIPGIVIGLTAAIAALESYRRRSNRAMRAHKSQTPKKRLYVYTMAEDVQ